MTDRTTELTPKQSAFCRAVVSGQTLSDSYRVLTKLREFMETAQPSDSAKIRAAELLGKSIGLFKDVTVTEKPVLSVAELEKKLERKLKAYFDKPDDAVH